MDPVMAAYLAAARPEQQPAALAGESRCSRCTRNAPLTPADTVISRTFTGFDTWAEPAGRGLCPACSWLYATPQLRRQPHRVTQQPTLTACAPRDLVDELTAGPLNPTVAIAVPLRPGRKHVFAGLAWGTIRVDDINLTWSATDATLLRDLADLRSAGFGPRMFTEAVPAFPVLRTNPASHWVRLLHLWAGLDAWRKHSRPHLDLGIALTRPAAA